MRLLKHADKRAGDDASSPGRNRTYHQNGFPFDTDSKIHLNQSTFCSFTLDALIQRVSRLFLRHGLRKKAERFIGKLDF